MLAHVGTKWLTRFERLIVGMNITDATQKRPLLLHYAGPDVDNIFETLPDTGEDKDYKKAVECLNTYNSFQKSTRSTRNINFVTRNKQRSNENLASYHTRLRQLAKHCGFADVDKEICTQIVFSCTSHKLRLCALREDLSLTALLEAGRVAEITDQQARDIQPTSSDQSVNALPSRSKPYPVHPDQHAPPHTPINQRTHTRSLCRNCGRPFPHAISCPCRSCGKNGHFAKVCHSRPQQRPHFVQQIADDPEQDAAYTFVIHSEQTVLNTSSAPLRPSPSCIVNIGGQPIFVLVDFGASANLLDEATYNSITHNTRLSATLNPPTTKIYSYGSTTPLPLLGSWSTSVRYKSTTVNATFHITKGNLLSCSIAQQLNLLTLNVNSTMSGQTILHAFPHLFDGIGQVTGKEIKLHISNTVTPKQQPQCRIPFHVRKDVEQELKRLKQLDIIGAVDGSTPWVSPIVVVPKKSGEISQPCRSRCPSRSSWKSYQLRQSRFRRNAKC